MDKMNLGFTPITCAPGRAQFGKYRFAPNSQQTVERKKVSTVQTRKDFFPYADIYRLLDPQKFTQLKVPYSLLDISDRLFKRFAGIDLIFCSHLELQGQGWVRGFVIDKNVPPETPYYFEEAEVLAQKNNFISDPFRTIFINAYTNEEKPRPLPPMQSIQTLLYFFRYLDITLNPPLVDQWYSLQGHFIEKHFCASFFEAQTTEKFVGKQFGAGKMTFQEAAKWHLDALTRLILMCQKYLS